MHARARAVVHCRTLGKFSDIIQGKDQETDVFEKVSTPLFLN